MISTNVGLSYQIYQDFVKHKMTERPGSSILFGVPQQAKVFAAFPTHGTFHCQKLPHRMKMAISPIIQKRNIHDRYLSQIACELSGTFNLILLSSPDPFFFVLDMMESSFLAA
jgi:hypothetical protein